MILKKALCIHDISCIGRCSLTVISPVISAMGIQCVPLPTSVLSTHFGGFGDVVCQDLTTFCEDTIKRYKELDFQFDCVYSGYLNSSKQADIVKKAFELSKHGIKICDPVMADHGKLYSSITNDLIKEFIDLCHHSDIILPNPTEALILLGEDYTKTQFTLDEITSIVQELSVKYSSVVITGVKLVDDSMICIGYDKKVNELFKINCNYIPVSYPGTGDLFGACFTAHIINNYSIKAACEKASKFVEECILTTYNDNTDTKLGVNLEGNLHKLL